MAIYIINLKTLTLEHTSNDVESARAMMEKIKDETLPVGDWEILYKTGKLTTAKLKKLLHNLDPSARAPAELKMLAQIVYSKLDKEFKPMAQKKRTTKQMKNSKGSKKKTSKKSASKKTSTKKSAGRKSAIADTAKVKIIDTSGVREKGKTAKVVGCITSGATLKNVLEKCKKAKLDVGNARAILKHLDRVGVISIK